MRVQSNFSATYGQNKKVIGFHNIDHGYLAVQLEWSIASSTEISNPLRCASASTLANKAAPGSFSIVKIHSPLSLVPVPVLHPVPEAILGGPPETRAQPCASEEAITQ